MGDQVYLSMECAQAHEDILIKIVNEGYLSKTFGETLDYLLEPDATYNANQVEITKTVKSWFESKRADPGSIGIEFGAFDKDGNQVAVKLEDVIADYSSRILQDRIKREGDQDIPYKAIEMYIATTGPGGN